MSSKTIPRLLGEVALLNDHVRRANSMIAALQQRVQQVEENGQSINRVVRRKKVLQPVVAPSRCLLYCRVSTDRQVSEGVSLDNQQEKLRAMAVVKGFAPANVEVILEEGESGKDLKRPGVQRVLALIETGSISTVIIYKLDRLTRNLRDMLDLLDVFRMHGVALVSLTESLDTETPVGRMLCNILGTFAQFERETIQQRVSAAMAHVKAKGGKVGNIAYGFSEGAGKMLVVNPLEQAILARMRELRGDGATLASIAATLNDEGLLTRRGSPWRVQYVDRCLKSSQPIA
jgi:site-specific DNA recombinase